MKDVILKALRLKYEGQIAEDGPKEEIINSLGRTSSLLHSTGGYSKVRKDVLFCVVSDDLCCNAVICCCLESLTLR